MSALSTRPPAAACAPMSTLSSEPECASVTRSIVIAPGERDEVVQRGPGAFLVTIPSPRLPVDRRYGYFHDEKALHRVLDEWRPDHVEASSPWSSATMVGPLAWTCDAGRWSCIRTRWRRTLTVGSAELRRSPRSIVGSGDSGATCAASATCSTRWCAPTRILPSGCASGGLAQRRDDPDGRRERHLLSRATIAGDTREPRWRRSGLVPMGYCWSASDGCPARSAGRR